MRIERYTARDSRTAMAQVRADLGADALILANRRVAGQVEITAALDIDEVVAGPATPTASATRPRVRPRAEQQRQPNEIQLKALEKELFRLRGILEKELGAQSWRDSSGSSAPNAALRQRLLRMGLSRTLTGSLLDALPRTRRLETAWRQVLESLADRLEPADSSAQVPITAVYGGTGVGKTSTIARLAGITLQRHGPDAVGLITLDNYRIGAQEQLASFADTLGIPLFTASDAHSLSLAVRKLRGRRLFIDTAGMSQHDARLRGQYELISALRKPTRHLLVLAASSQASQSRALAAIFGRGALSGAIISKVDEAQSLGGVLDVVISAALPLFGFSDGQRIPEDLRAADASELVRRAALSVEGDHAPEHHRALRRTA